MTYLEILKTYLTECCVGGTGVFNGVFISIGIIFLFLGLGWGMLVGYLSGAILGMLIGSYFIWKDVNKDENV